MGRNTLDGGHLSLFAGNTYADNSATGGSISIHSGYSNAQSSGSIFLRTLNVGTTGVSGEPFSTGTTSSGSSGSISIGTGSASGGKGGDITIKVGDGNTLDGGHLSLFAGNTYADMQLVDQYRSIVDTVMLNQVVVFSFVH